MVFSLALFGLLVGMMAGRLTTPEPARLEQVEILADGLALRFNVEPNRYAEHLDGAFAMLFQATGEDAAGRLRLASGPANWRLQRTERGLLLHLVAARPLRAEWRGEAGDGAWRLIISAREE